MRFPKRRSAHDSNSSIRITGHIESLVPHDTLREPVTADLITRLPLEFRIYYRDQSSGLFPILLQSITPFFSLSRTIPFVKPFNVP